MPIQLEQSQRCLERLHQRKTARRPSSGRSFLKVSDLTPDELRAILDGALQIKADPGRYSQLLHNSSIALLFQKTSTRTRCSFEVGISELGGYPIYLDWSISNFGRADLRDEIRSLTRYFEMIVARVIRHGDLLTMKKFSEVPIVNGLSTLHHPCQGLADAMTMLEYFGELKGLRVAYIGDGNNTCNSLMEVSVLSGAEFVVAHPPGYAPKREVLDALKDRSMVTLMNDPREAVRGADVVYTDTWISMGDESESEARLQAFTGYQVDEELLSHAQAHTLFMHCLPAQRDQEVSSGALDSPNSVVFDQAENRKHAQKALLGWISGRL